MSWVAHGNCCPSCAADAPGSSEKLAMANFDVNLRPWLLRARGLDSSFPPAPPTAGVEIFWVDRVDDHDGLAQVGSGKGGGPSDAYVRPSV